MKSPNESNIDEWLFHYFEGDLSPEEESLIEEFLLEHPQFDAQFEAWGASRIQQESFVYPKQDILAKPLVPFGLLHKAAVFSAIAVNAVLAGFIIFGNKEQTAQYNAVQLQELFLNDEFTSQNQLAVIQNSYDNDFSNAAARNNSSYFALNAGAPNSLLNLGSNANLNVSSNSLSSSRNLISGVSSTNQTSSFNFENTNLSLPEVDTDVTYAKYVNASGIQDLARQQVEQGRVAVASNQTNEYKAEESKPNSSENEALAATSVPNVPAKSGDLKDSKEAASNARAPKETGGRDLRTPLNPKRFKTGAVLLTNSRSQEYLVPGGNRNTINFAHVGSDFANTAYWNSYAQWPEKNNQLFVNQLGYDMFIPEIKSGLGIQMMYSTYGNGVIRDFETALTYSPKFILSKNFILEPAVRLRMSTTGVDRGQLSPGNWVEFDRVNAFQYSQNQSDAFVNRSIQQDLGFGLLLNSKWGFVGVNADHVLGNRNHALHYDGVEDLGRAPMFVNAVLGTEYESLNKKLLWSGQMIYQNHGQLNKIWLGTRIKYNFLSLGASVSSRGEPMFSAGFVSNGISILYSGDYSYSRMYNDKFLSHQLLLRVTLKESRMKKLLLN
jgi:hypothetical protein